MTGSNDLDRMLASYLEEGPRRAPDRAVDAALTFAAAHPRRRDPLLFIKSDVMARRSSMFSPQFVWVGAVIALTLAAVAAIAVGTRPSQEPVVPPSVVESPSPSARPSASPSPQVFSVVVTDEHESDHPVDVIDESGRLVAVDPGPAYTGRRSARPRLRATLSPTRGCSSPGRSQGAAIPRRSRSTRPDPASW